MTIPDQEAPLPDGGPTARLNRRQRRIVLGICSLSLFVTYLDSTILNVALPTIENQLHAGLSDLQWVVDAYMLVLASLLLLTGSTGDRIGRRQVFCVGLVTFGAGSLLCSLAPNIEALIAFRALQAIGGSMLTPVSLSIVRNTFTDPGERVRAIGAWSGVFGLAMACGPPLGGLLVDLLGWRSVFWVNVPVGIAAFFLARRFIPESRAERSRPFDPPGQVLIVVVLASLTYGIIQGPTSGWTSPSIVGLFALAAAGTLALAVVERRRAEPVLEVRFFRSIPFTGANAVATCSFTVLAGFLFVNTLYLQQARGDSALVAGLSTIPATAMVAVSGPCAGVIVARRGTRLPLTAAGLLLAAGSALLLGVTPHTPYLELVAGYVVLGVGLGVVNPPITSTAVSSMPNGQAGVASAVVSSFRQLGNVLGVAVTGALLASRFRSGLSSRLAPLPLNAAARSALSHTGVGAAGGNALPPAVRHGPAVAAALKDALAGATHAPWVLGIGCGLACAVLGVLSTGRRARASAAAAYSEPATAQAGDGPGIPTR